MGRMAGDSAELGVALFTPRGYGAFIPQTVADLAVPVDLGAGVAVHTSHPVFKMYVDNSALLSCRVQVGEAVAFAAGLHADRLAPAVDQRAAGLGKMAGFAGIDMAPQAAKVSSRQAGQGSQSALLR